MLEDKSVATLFNQILTMKIRGYQSEYPDGVLPVDTSDFMAYHHVVCLELKNELRPIMGFKTTPISRSERHRLTFPAISLAQQAGATEHVRAIEKIIARCKAEGRELTYASSWTVDPIFRKDRESAKELRGLFETLYVKGHESYGIDEMLLGGTLRFKTEVIFKNLGHEPLMNANNEPLPLINVKHLFGENVMIMHAKEFKPYAHEVTAPFQAMWDNRIEISPDSKDATLKKLLVA